MRRDIARIIRRLRPEAVVVGSWDVEFVAGLDQADHLAAGRGRPVADFRLLVSNRSLPPSRSGVSRRQLPGY